ncbi:MAG: dephospho-CoA kinase [Lachnospiraceae bacterium]|jgi:dephospho-CoA kinase|nr:dephospho-CoA kinase [Lachnospiraceae bacterium]
MKIIGITGGIGSGKTQVMEYMHDRYGATICHADDVAKKLQKKGQPCYEPIVSFFGNEILDNKNEIDRKKLANIVFADKEKLRVLNSIVHPEVKSEIQRRIKSEQKKHTNLFLIEAALLIEDGYKNICNELWFIYTKKCIRLNRLRYSRGIESEKVEAIMDTQLSKEEYLKNCDRVIDNSGAFAETCEQLDAILKKI